MKAKLTILLLFTSLTSMGQQDAQYTQYMYNTVNINPAYAGSRGVLSMFGLHRTQWVGLEGAPITNAIAVNTPIGDTKLGIGLSLVNDKIGPINSNSLSADMSYTINLNSIHKLSFGIKTTGNLFSMDGNELNLRDESDLKLQSVSNSFSPNFGTGAYLHSDRSYLGLSVRNFLKTVTYSDVAIYKERLNLYLIGGYVFDLNYATQFKPAFLAKAVQGAPLQIDVSGNVLFNDKVMFGLAYRWSAAVSAMAGFQVSNSLYLGYGYDFDTTTLGTFNSGSHEVFIRFEIFKNDRITSPRFF